MKLESLPGVGPRLAETIRASMDDEKFLAAAEAQDVATIQQVAGLSPKRAVDLVRRIHGTPLDAFAKTPAAMTMAHELLAEIQSYAATEHGRNQALLLGPLPTPEEAEARCSYVMTQKKRVAALDREAVRQALRQVRALRDPDPVADLETAVIAGSDDAFDRLHRLGVGHWAMLCTAGDPTHQEAGLRILAYDGDASMDADVEVPCDGPLCDIVPRALHAWLGHNRRAIQACAELARLTGRDSVAPALLDLEPPSPIGETLDVEGVVETILATHNQSLSDRVADLSLTGADMVAAMAHGALPPPVAEAATRAAKEAQQAFSQQTGCRANVFQATLPMRTDARAVDEAVREYQARQGSQAFESMRAGARQIAKAQEALAAEVAAWLAFDGDFALGCFALHHDLRPPRIGHSLDLQDSVHLKLSQQPEAQPIRYHLGKDADLAVLTGANSGGKSTLLEHLCQVVLMTRMGLPVVGDVEVPWYDELHLVTAKRGLDAGAFETFLRSFMPIVQGDARRLVLADEVESVTELEAAGRILAFWLDRLAATQSHAIVVTHMARAILEHVTAQVRVDGIEATGLDASNRLLVDRTPRMGVMARSTPELIVQRLVATQTGAERTLFQDLHAAMLDPKNA